MEAFQLSYIQFSSTIDLGFWTTLSKKKIEEYKLDDTPKPIWIKYRSNPHPDKVSHLNFDIYSFTEPNDTKSGPYETFLNAQVWNFNTIEAYKNQDTNEFLKKQSQLLVNEIQNGGNKTLKASLLMFADLKKYLFNYKLLVPTVKVDNLQFLQKKKLVEVYTNSQEFFINLKKIVNKIALKELISSPFIFFDKETFEIVKLEDAHTSQNVLYFDAFNGDQISAGFQNFLAYMIINKFTSVQVCVIKDPFTYTGQRFELKNSQWLHLGLENAKISDDIPEVIVQENFRDLKGFMDEKELAGDAVDLNIKLMKWRMLPHLDLEMTKQTKCLLFGAGTLGCQLARNLIGWGIRHITFVDYGKVSYSNPVRQSLFNFEDSCQGGKPKAETAAENLKKIFPACVTQGLSIEIPMPGHYVGEAQVAKTLESIKLLDELVAQHDVLFLLTDSRESRWFPTVLANKHQKISFAVALGFDSFCVIRQGASLLKHNPEIHGDRLGCYFCNDISAPQDSMRDRTLDQQCTVTRPGLSFLAAAYSSELLVSLIQHPLREAAPASDNINELETTDLGVLPHFLRGQLSDFEVKIFYGKAFQSCVACSKHILDEYETKGEEFILKVMNQPDYLQDVTGITESLKSETLLTGIEIIDDDFAIIQ